MVDFETTEDISEETFKRFKKAYLKMIEDDFDASLLELAEEHGFEIENVWSISEDESYPLKAT